MAGILGREVAAAGGAVAGLLATGADVLADLEVRARGVIRVLVLVHGEDHVVLDVGLHDSHAAFEVPDGGRWAGGVHGLDACDAQGKDGGELEGVPCWVAFVGKS